MMGVGYHHAGVDLSDRKLIEKAFTQADLPVLCESLYTTVVNVIVTLLLRTECTWGRGSANIMCLWCCWWCCSYHQYSGHGSQPACSSGGDQVHDAVYSWVLWGVQWCWYAADDRPSWTTTSNYRRMKCCFNIPTSAMGEVGVVEWLIIFYLFLWNQFNSFGHSPSLTHQRLQWSWQRSKAKTSTWNLWMEWKSLRAGNAFIQPPCFCDSCSCLSGRWDNSVLHSVLLSPSLHSHLVEHLNAEIVLQTISDVNMALDWIRSTFLYIRALKNPSHYGQSSEQRQTTATVQVFVLDYNLWIHSQVSTPV